MMDTDHDGISDEDERLYRTNPDDPDTDHDGYTDRTEIDASWNPLSSELSPGQSLYSQNMRNETLSSEMQSLPPVHSLAQDTTLWWGARFSAILTQIRIYVDDHGDWRSFGILLFSVFLLGFVHAIGPGHSKGILISQILDQHMSLSKGMLYSLIFSIFHLLDIIIVVLISKYLLWLFDPGKYLGSIQMMSIFLILWISTYLLIFSIRRILKKDSTREKDQKNRFFMGNNHIFLAIISGITPCAFGWSIFLLLFAVKRTDLALPLLLALGAGIFLCLLLVTLGTFLFKSSIYRFSPRLGLYSPVVSSVFLFGIGSFLLSQSF